MCKLFLIVNYAQRSEQLMASINIKDKPGKVNDKRMLQRREECDNYLTHICRHLRSVENPVKR